MAFVLQSSVLSCWAMGEGNMVVCNIVEEMNFLLLEEQASSDRVHWSVAPTLIEEAAVAVQSLEKVKIRFGA